MKPLNHRKSALFSYDLKEFQIRRTLVSGLRGWLEPPRNLRFFMQIRDLEMICPGAGFCIRKTEILQNLPGKTADNQKP